MADIIFPDALPLDSLAIPLWCRAQCRVLYPELGVGAADEELIARIRADFSVARRSEPLLYALRPVSYTHLGAQQNHTEVR